MGGFFIANPGARGPRPPVPSAAPPLVAGTITPSSCSNRRLQTFAAAAIGSWRGVNRVKCLKTHRKKHIYIFLIKTHLYTNTVLPFKRTVLYKFARLGGTVWIELCFQVVDRLLIFAHEEAKPSLHHNVPYELFIVFVNSKAGS